MMINFSKKQNASLLVSVVFACLTTACSPTSGGSASDRGSSPDSGGSNISLERGKPNSGKRLDATNSDTLRDSIRVATASMSEADRIILAQDIELIYTRASGKELTSYGLQRHLFPDTNINRLDLSDIALSIGNQITDKSPAQIHTLASATRKELLLKGTDDLLAEIDAEEMRSKVQLICTQNAMDPAVNPGGHRATGWAWTLQGCQSRLSQLPRVRTEVLEAQKRIKSFDFAESSFDAAENFEIFQKLNMLASETRCYPNGAFCPSDAELRARQQPGVGSAPKRPGTDIFGACTNKGFSEARCNCFADTVKSNLTPQVFSRVQGEMFFDSSYDEDWLMANFTPIEMGQIAGAMVSVDISCPRK